MEIFNKNMSKILDIQLALESYQDNTGENTELVNEAFDKISILRANKNTFSTEELIKKSNELLLFLNEVLDVIGRKKFIFYNDGGIGYEWNKSLLKGGKNNGKRQWQRLGICQQ